MKISIMLPSYNEEKNLEFLIPELIGILDSTAISYEIIVVDALLSSDNTESLCKKFNSIYIRQADYGYGDAFRKGIECARGELFLVVDSDASQDIGKIPLMLKEIENGADVVIGSRYTKGGKTADPIFSVVMSKMLNTAYRLILGFKEKDISTDFRMYKADLLKGINLTCSNFDIIEETLFLLKKTYPKIIIKEIPICYKKRAEGVSKRRLAVFIADYIKLLVRLSALKKGEG